MLKEYKILIYGGYGLSNFGDDALMIILVEKLKFYFHEQEVIFTVHKNIYDKNILNGFAKIDHSDINSIKVSCFVYGGGTQFYSFGPNIQNIQYQIKKILSDPRILIKKLTSKFTLSETKEDKNYTFLAALGIGVGPFFQRRNKKVELMAKNLFSNMDYLSVRDSFSEQKCREWDIKNYRHDADLCYLMDVEKKLVIRRRKELKKIGIIVRDWDRTFEGHAYYAKIDSLIDDLNKRNYQVDIIIFSEKSDHYWMKYVEDKQNILIWKPMTQTYIDFLQHLNNYDLFITGRYHGAIFASLLNIPFISIVVEQKLELISEVYKYGSEKWKYPFRNQECLSEVENIAKNYEKYTTGIIDQNIIQRKKAKEMWHGFIEFCKSIDIIEKGLK